MRIIDILQNPSYPLKNVAEKLICYKLKISKETLFTDSDREISPSDCERITQSYSSYATDKKPLEYILGFVEFLGVRFQVTPATLIPRPETEYMIIAVNEFIHADSSNDGSVTIIDVGTGCWVLWLSTLIHNHHKIKQLFLSELSEDALDVARKNYELLKNDTGVHSLLDSSTPVTFLQSDLVADPTLTGVLQTQQHVVLVANLPYIPDQTFDDNVEDNVKKREPRMAFVWGDDGLDLYRRMFDQIIQARKDMQINSGSTAFSTTTPSSSVDVPNVLVDSSSTTTHEKNFTMFLEMMTRQVDILRTEYKNVLTFEEVKTFHFNIRIVKAEFKQ